MADPVLPRTPFSLRQVYVVDPGGGGIQASFANVPAGKRLVIELFSFQLHDENANNQFQPIFLWAHPGANPPPNTREVFFPFEAGKHPPGYYGATHSLRLYLEPGDSWGVSFNRTVFTNKATLTVFVSGYYLPPTSPTLSP